jgi:HTH-type transcriptional regulator, sugar sensing transcriptional regulator
MKTSMIKILENLGFTKNESEIYLVLLNQGSQSAGKIASKVGIHRRSVYDALERLAAKGAIGYIKENNLKNYSVNDPNQLLSMIKQKEHEISSILPELSEIYSKTKSKKETVFFKGKEGIRHIFQDQLKEKEEILVIGGSNRVYELLRYYIPHYERERKNLKIKTKLIFDTKEQMEIPNSEIRYVKHSLGPTSTNIYGNKVGIIVWSENPYAILINDQSVAQSYKEHFKLLWEIAGK